MTLKMMPLNGCVVVKLKKEIAQESAECGALFSAHNPLGVIKHKCLDFVGGIFGHQQHERYQLTSFPMKWQVEWPPVHEMRCVPVSPACESFYQWSHFWVTTEDLFPRILPAEMPWHSSDSS